MSWTWRWTEAAGAAATEAHEPRWSHSLPAPCHYSRVGRGAAAAAAVAAALARRGRGPATTRAAPTGRPRMARTSLAIESSIRSCSLATPVQNTQKQKQKGPQREEPVARAPQQHGRGQFIARCRRRGVGKRGGAASGCGPTRDRHERKTRIHTQAHVSRHRHTHTLTHTSVLYTRPEGRWGERRRPRSRRSTKGRPAAETLFRVNDDCRAAS